MFQDKKYLFKEYDERSNKLCNALLGLGIRKGDRVAVLLDNCNHFTEAHGVLAQKEV